MDAITSSNDGIGADWRRSPKRSLAWIMECFTLAALQEQHVRLTRFGAGFFASQAGLSHCNSHFGLGQVVGFLHFQSHLVSSHIGVHTGSGATQEVRQLAGEQTVSHLGQSFFSHISLGQRTLHCGLSQWTLHLAQAVSSHWIWHFGRSQTGWHLAGQTGSSHCHLHCGWQSFSTSKKELSACTAIASNKTAAAIKAILRNISFDCFG